MGANWLDQLGNWNPQLLREIKGRSKPSYVLLAAIGSLLGQLLLLFYFFRLLPASPTNTASNPYCTGKQAFSSVSFPSYQCFKDAAGQIILDWQRFWSEPFLLLSLIGIFALLVVGPYLLITDLAQEQRRGTLNLIRLSPQPTSKILVGKLLGVPILLYIVAVLAIPLHLWAGLSAGIALSQILSFYVVLVASCGFFYSASLLYSLTTSWLGSLQALVGSGAMFVFLRGTYILLHGYAGGSNGPLTWLELLSPATALPTPEGASPGMWILLLGFSGANLDQLQWFYLPLGVNTLTALMVSLVNYGLWIYWIWQMLRHCFDSSSRTLLSKGQSYGLVICFEITIIGFALQDFSVLPRSLEDEIFFSNFLALVYLNILLFLFLMAALPPHRQALLDWARYQQGRGSAWRLGGSAWIRDLIWGEKSPAILAIALNAAIAATFCLVWIVLWPYDVEEIPVFLRLLLSLNVLLMVAAIAQLLLLRSTPKRVLWTVGVVGGVMVLPPALAFVLGINQIPGLWLISGVPIRVSPWRGTMLLGICGQWLILGLLSWQLSRQLHRLGASSSKALFAE